jgi:DeoR/GlpR family transcriptional regulator of sugar metabolism
MKPDNRRQGIMDLMMEAGSASVDDLSARFGVSKMTIHRDLDELEAEGLLRKVRGGASIQSSGQFESDFRYRQRLAVEEKARIAVAASRLIEPGQTVIIDDGSTTAGVARHLLETRPLTVITNNLAAIAGLADAGGVTLIGLGGRYNKKFHGFFGLIAEETLRSLRADVALISTSAVQGLSAYHQDQEVVQSKRLMIAAASRRFLLVDRAKFGRTALHFLTDLKVFDGIITGEPLAVEDRALVEQAGIPLTIAGKA